MFDGEIVETNFFFEKNFGLKIFTKKVQEKVQERVQEKVQERVQSL